MKISADFLKKFIIIVLAALGLEVLVFNFRALQSLFYREVSYPLEECEMEYFDEYDDHVFKLKADNGVMYLTGLEEKMDGRTLHNVHLDISLPDAIDMPMVETGILTIEPYMRDAGHDAYARLAEHKVRDDIPVSKYLWVSGAGAIKTLTFGLSFTNGKLIQIHKITLNAHQPVCFSVWRFLLLIVLCSMVYGMRKESVLWKEEGGATVWQRWLPAALGCLLILPAAYLIFQNDYLTSSVNFQPYHELAEALADGRVYLTEEVPQWLQEMDNPYDDTLRTVLAEETGQDFKWDYAYFNGRYYVYFGIVPCLLFYLPTYLMLGTHMPNTLPILFAAIATFAGIFLLIRKIARRIGNVPYALQLMLTVAVYYGCQIPFFLNQPDAYAVPVICGEMFTVWGLYLWMCAKTRKGRLKKVLLAAGSLCMALVAGCRPNMALYSFLAFVLFADELKQVVQGTKEEKKCVLAQVFCFALPYVLVAAGLMYYNAVRFGSPFDFGFAYNLTTQDTSRMVWSLDKLWAGICEYLFRLPDLTYTFPFMSIAGDGTQKNLFAHTVFQMEYIFGGLIPCNLILLLLPTVFSKKKDADAAEKELKRFGVAAAVIAVLLMLLDTQLAGVVYRYLADFSLLLLVAASIAVMLCHKKLAGTEAANIFRCAIILMCIASVLFHVNFYWLSGLKYPLLWGNTGLYYRIRYAFMFW